MKIKLLSLVSVFTLLSPARASEVFLSLSRASAIHDSLPTSVETVSAKEFDRWNAQTAGDVVSRLTSLQIQPVGGLGSVQTVRIRGSNTNQNLVLIDGRPVGSVAFASSQDLTEIPVEAIERVEVLRGGASSVYGPNALAGVINIITKRPTEENPTGKLGYEYGSYGRNIFRGSAGAKTGPFSYFLYGNRQGESGFRENSKASTLNVGSNLGLSLGRGGQLQLDSALYQAEQGIPGQFFPAIPTNQFDNNRERVAVSPDANQDTTTKSLRASYELPLPMDSRLTTKLWGSERRVIYQDVSSFVDTNRVEATKGAEIQVNALAGLVFGSSFMHDKETSIDHISPGNDFTRDVENVGFFVEQKIHVKPFTLIPSGRFDKHSQFGWSKNPRVLGILDVTDHFRLSGSAARAFRAPTIDELYYPFTNFGCFFGSCFSYEGNPGLKPETSWTYDAGFEVHQDSFSFKTTFFRANVSDLIQTTLDPASTVVNIGVARRQGAEIQLSHQLNQYVQQSWNYTYLDNRGIPPGFTEKVELRYSPRHTVNWITTISPCPLFDWDNALRFVDARYAGNNETSTKLGSMILWDMKFTQRWREIEAYFSVRDVTDRRYEEQAGYPLPGRSYIGGVSWKF